MFFGLEVKSNQNSAKPLKLESSLRISQAVLEPSKNGKREPVSVMVEHEKKQFIVCVLDHNTAWQSPLDLMFEAGKQFKFFLRGQGTVHLTGYEIRDDMDMDDLSISEIDSDEASDGDDTEELVLQQTSGSAKKAGKVAKTNGVKSSPDKKKVLAGVPKVNQDDDQSDDSDDEDFDDMAALNNMRSSDEDDDDEDEDDDDDSEDDDDDMDEDMSDEDMSDEEGETD